MQIKLFITMVVLFTLPLAANSQSFGKGLDFDDVSYQSIDKKAKLTRSLEIIPTNGSVKQFAPTPGNQSYYGTCTAWATAYCGRTIVEAVKNNWTDKNFITSKAYAPAYLFRMLSPDDEACKGGTSIALALQLIKDKGVIPYQLLPVTCTPTLTAQQMTNAENGKIKDFMRLFDSNSDENIKIQSVKKSIAEKKPVVFGMICPPSFNKTKGTWLPTEEPNTSFGGHAMCVVGYDDTKDGGAFEVQNSWGTTWGNDGYIWIKYADFAKFTKYAFEFIDLPATKPAVADLSGQIRLALADGKEMPATLYTSTRGLKVVPAKPAAGPLTVYQTSEVYTTGTRFRIYISNNEPAYVYAISTDLTNEITKIFPYEDGISAALTDKKNDVAIPDEDHFIEFDNKAGKDFLCVLYSKNELNINDIINKIGSQQGTFSERIFKAIGDQIVDTKDISFTKEKISFTAFSKGKTIVPMMVELEHK